MNYYLGLIYLDYAVNIVFKSEKELNSSGGGGGGDFELIKKYIAKAVSQPKQDIKVPKPTPTKLEGEGEGGGEDEGQNEDDKPETEKTSHNAVKHLLKKMNEVFENGGADTGDPSVKRFISEMSKIYNTLKKFVPDQGDFGSTSIKDALVNKAKDIIQKEFSDALKESRAAEKIQRIYKRKQKTDIFKKIPGLKDEEDKEIVRVLLTKSAEASQEGNSAELNRLEGEITKFLKSKQGGGGGKTRRRCVRINLKKSRKPKVAKKINRSKRVKLNLRQTYKNKN